MSFWNRILKGSSEESPRIAFGRYSDTFKSKESYLAWDESLKLYEDDKVLESIKKLIEYLKNKTSDNIHFHDENNPLNFTMYHGSKQVVCSIDKDKFRAESKIAHCKELNVGFLRKAVEFNYHLNYSRFALDENDNLCLIFDSFLVDASPYKLFYGLKEVSLQSDKEDDILLNEFEYLEPIHNQHILILSEEIIQIKLHFIREKVRNALAPEVLGTLNPKRFQGALTYIYLSVVYTMDYLVKPEGKLMEILSRAHIKYFETPSQHIEIKIAGLEKELKEIDSMTDAELSKELYEVISTFGITSPTNHSTVAQFIDAELQALKWYEENKHDFICLAICNYVAGYCVYNYAMPVPVQELFHLYYEITEPNYFEKLGFNNKYWKDNQSKLNMSEIYDQIEEILKKHKASYPNLPYSISLEDESLALFLKSYLLFIKNLPIA